MTSEKLDVIHNWTALEYQTQLMRFLGITRFYRKFVKTFACLAQALTYILGKDKKNGDEEQLKS